MPGHAGMSNMARYIPPAALRVRSCLSTSRTRFSIRGTKGYSSSVLDDTVTSDLALDELRSRHYVYRDYMTSQPTVLLLSALESFLPHAKRPGVGQDGDDGVLNLGFQHAYFRPHLCSEDLCSDGTDIKFLPGPENIWQYRLWAGGSVTHHHEQPPRLANKPPSLVLLERASDVRVVDEQGKAAKVFVTIRRQFMLSKNKQSSDEMITSMVQAKEAEPNPKSVFMTETENICFLRDPPKSLKDTRKIKPPANPIYTHTMTPTRSLLFQFSALTYNAHSIHLDSEFARNQYGASDLVVHGPLTQVLMLEFMRRFLQTLNQDQTISPIVTSIRYTNLQPLYVDQPLTLCCQPASNFSDKTLTDVDTWQVWIQKGTGENASLAVKATVDVGGLHLLKRSSSSQVSERHDTQSGSSRPRADPVSTNRRPTFRKMYPSTG